MENSFKLLPAIKPKNVGCLCCGSSDTSHLSLDTVLYNGFGGYHATKDGEMFYEGDCNGDWNSFLTARNIEAYANNDPDHDWRIICFTPLHGETWQRQDGKWVLVDENLGFA